MRDVAATLAPFDAELDEGVSWFENKDGDHIAHKALASGFEELRDVHEALYVALEAEDFAIKHHKPFIAHATLGYFEDESYPEDWTVPEGSFEATTLIICVPSGDVEVKLGRQAAGRFVGTLGVGDRLDQLSEYAGRKVTVYRGVPSYADDALRPGDYVMLDREPVVHYSLPRGRVVSSEVDASDLEYRQGDEFRWLPTLGRQAGDVVPFGRTTIEQETLRDGRTVYMVKGTEPNTRAPFMLYFETPEEARAYAKGMGHVQDKIPAAGPPMPVPEEGSTWQLARPTGSMMGIEVVEVTTRGTSPVVIVSPWGSEQEYALPLEQFWGLVDGGRRVSMQSSDLLQGIVQADVEDDGRPVGDEGDWAVPHGEVTVNDNDRFEDHDLDESNEFTFGDPIDGMGRSTFDGSGGHVPSGEMDEGLMSAPTRDAARLPPALPAGWRVVVDADDPGVPEARLVDAEGNRVSVVQAQIDQPRKYQVSWASTASRYQGKGYGRIAYDALMRWCTQRGATLASDGIVSDDAASVWDDYLSRAREVGDVEAVPTQRPAPSGHGRPREEEAFRYRYKMRDPGTTHVGAWAPELPEGWEVRLQGAAEFGYIEAVVKDEGDRTIVSVKASEVRPKTWQVIGARSYVRGFGYGRIAYQALFAWAKKNGFTLASDYTVSDHATKVWNDIAARPDVEAIPTSRPAPVRYVPPEDYKRLTRDQQREYEDTDEKRTEPSLMNRYQLKGKRTAEDGVTRQQTKFTCGPAVLRALFELHNFDEADEEELRTVAGTTEEEGTSPEGLVRALEAYGFEAEVAETLTAEQIAEVIGGGGYVILDVDMWDGEHWVLVEDADEHGIEIMDPSAAEATSVAPIVLDSMRWDSETQAVRGGVVVYGRHSREAAQRPLPPLPESWQTAMVGTVTEPEAVVVDGFGDVVAFVRATRVRPAGHPSGLAYQVELSRNFSRTDPERPRGPWGRYAYQALLTWVTKHGGTLASDEFVSDHAVKVWEELHSRAQDPNDEVEEVSTQRPMPVKFLPSEDRPGHEDEEGIERTEESLGYRYRMKHGDVRARAGATVMMVSGGQVFLVPSEEGWGPPSGLVADDGSDYETLLRDTAWDAAQEALGVTVPREPVIDVLHTDFGDFRSTVFVLDLPEDFANRVGAGEGEWWHLVGLEDSRDINPAFGDWLRRYPYLVWHLIHLDEPTPRWAQMRPDPATSGQVVDPVGLVYDTLLAMVRHLGPEGLSWTASPLDPTEASQFVVVRPEDRARWLAAAGLDPASQQQVLAALASPAGLDSLGKCFQVAGVADKYTVAPSDGTITLERSATSPTVRVAASRRLVHYSTTPGLKEIDPAFLGSGQLSNRERQDTQVPASFYYFAGTQPETLLTSTAKARYEAELPPGATLLDLATEGAWGSQQWREGGRAQLYNAIKARRFSGFFNSDSGLPNAVIVFYALPVTETPLWPQNVVAMRATQKRALSEAQMEMMILAPVIQQAQLPSIPDATETEAPPVVGLHAVEPPAVEYVQQDEQTPSMLNAKTV